ncbi:MAG: creatininase family protein [Thermoplasmatales archaeon]|nr:creatininase family protein [Thermoplasmatales archaeon]
MKIEDMSWKEVDKISRDAIIFISISPLEAHGPHLPLATDLLISKKVEEALMEKMEENGIEILSLPSLPLGVCRYARNFPGTINVSWKNLYNILMDIFLSFSKHNFKYFLILNFHMDIFHIKAIHKAIKKARKKGIVACEPISIAYFKGELFEKDEYEIHGDIKETSLALYLFPERIKKCKVEDVKIKMHALDFFKTFEEIGAKDAYIGSPSLAKKEYGEKFFKKMVEICFKSAMSLKEGKTDELPEKLKILLGI